MKELSRDKTTLWAVIAACILPLLAFQYIRDDHNSQQSSANTREVALTVPNSSSSKSEITNYLIRDINSLKDQLPKDLGNGLVWTSVVMDKNDNVKFTYQHKTLSHEQLLLAVDEQPFFDIELCFAMLDEPGYKAALSNGITVVMAYYGLDGALAKRFFINKFNCNS